MKKEVHKMQPPLDSCIPISSHKHTLKNANGKTDIL